MLASIVLRALWWPAFAFVYPLLAWPWSASNTTPFHAHAYPTLFFLAGGALLEINARGWKSFGDIGRAFLRLRHHPAVLLACVFGVWVVVGALLAPQPALALTGSLVYASDGALWQVALVGVFVLVYAQTLRDPGLVRRLARAVVASGVVLVAGSTAEVLLQHALVTTVHDSALPIMTFPQKGHLAGMFALVAGVAMALRPRFLTAVLAFGIGLTVNRSAGVAVLVASLVPLLSARRGWRSALSLLVLCAVGLAAGVGTVKLVDLSAGTHSKQVASVGSVKSRVYHYLASVRGIAARPIFGWGGGNFDLTWPNYLSDNEMQRFGRLEWGFAHVDRVSDYQGGLPMLLARDGDGKKVAAQVLAFKAHDVALDAALLWGLPGAAMYLTLLALGLRGLGRKDPLSWGLLAYLVFLLLWFVIPDTQGVLWAILGVAAGSNRSRSGSWRREATVRGTAESDAI